MRLFGKKGMEMEMIGWWALALAAGALMFAGYSIVTGKGSSAIEFIQNMFRFGR